MKAELIYGMPREQYDALKADNISRLKLIEQSPAHYRHGVDNEQEDKDAFRFGRAGHLNLLEPDEYRRQVVMKPGFSGKGAVAAREEWEAAHADKVIVTESEVEKLAGIAESVRRCEYAQPYLTGKVEASLLWATQVVPGLVVPCKGRLDVEADEALVDLKLVRCSSPAAFGKQAWNLSYFAQGAFYRDGYEAATGKRKPFAFVVVEKEPPYCVCVYVMTEEQHARGREDYQRWLATLSLCRLDDKWPGYATAPMPVVLPPWAQRQAEQSFTAEQAEAAQ